MKYRLVCTRCGAETNDSASFRCHVCHAILEVEYDYKMLKLGRDFKKQKISNAKYQKLFPVVTLAATLGEGGTPLKRNARLANGTDLFFKTETTNPTRTFKDRGSAVEITKAMELDFDHVCCASTGNMGYSVAYYAIRQQMKATIFISRDADAVKINKIKGQKAAIVRINGDFNKALKAAEVFAAKNKVFVCGDYHYRKEGQKSLGYEVIEQLNYNAPDYLFVPVGNATLISGVYKGMREFKALGLIKKIPKLIAVQSSGCDPIVKAFEERRDVKYTVPKTIADAIAVGYPTFGFECMRALIETHGKAIAVSDSEIRNAMNELRKNGIESELGGAAAYAGFKEMMNTHGNELKDKRVVVVISGNK